MNPYQSCSKLKLEDPLEILYLPQENSSKEKLKLKFFFVFETKTRSKVGKISAKNFSFVKIPILFELKKNIQKGQIDIFVSFKS